MQAGPCTMSLAPESEKIAKNSDQLHAVYWQGESSAFWTVLVLQLKVECGHYKI